MKKDYRKYLFNKGILVSSEQRDEATYAYVVFSLRRLFGIRITEGWERACESMILDIGEWLGNDAAEPFYRGFPESVLKLSPIELVADQLLHYLKVYFLDGADEAGESVFEQAVRRRELRERIELKDYRIVTEEEAMEMISESVGELCQSTRPLSDGQYALLLAYARDFGCEELNIASRSVVIRLLLDTRDGALLRLLELKDFITVVEYLAFSCYGQTRVDKLSLKNTDRRFLTSLLDALLEAAEDITPCYEKKAKWCGILHHLHYKARCAKGEELLRAMRGKGNLSTYSRVDKAMAEGDTPAAAEILYREKGGTAVLRSLNRLLTYSSSEEQVDKVLGYLKGATPVATIQLIKGLVLYSGEPRTFVYSRLGRLVHAAELVEAAEERRLMPDGIRMAAIDALRRNLARYYRGRLGRVYIDPAMSRIALPMNGSASASGVGVLPTGSLSDLEGEGRYLRLFVHWSEVDDVDLSVMAISEQGRETEFSWRTMYENQRDCITFSGDQVAGYDGGSEYFDLKLDLFRKRYPSARYLVVNANVYSDRAFRDITCRAGYMLRKDPMAGKVFEPSTVKTSIDITANARYAHLFAIDLEAMELVWLNVADAAWEAIAGQTEQKYLLAYLRSTEIMNMEQLFSLLCTERVDNPDLAEVIVSDRAEDRREGAELIRSCDTDRVLALMN